MEAEKIITPEDRDAIKIAIGKAERLTSGEIRVFVDDTCPGNVLDRAAHLFHKLEMDKTKDRNGVLIYLSIVDRKHAIIGDSGIHAKVKDDFWNTIKEEMMQHFKEQKITKGLLHAINEAGKALSVYFPLQKDDTDELPDDIIFGGEG